MVKTFRLPNGITCVCDERPGAGKVAMRVQFRAGAGDEPPEEAGLTNLMQEAIRNGTATRSRAQIANELETRGSGLQAGAEPETTYFSTEVLARKTEEGFGILADMLNNPAFNPADLKLSQERLARDALTASLGPAGDAEAKFEQAAFGVGGFGAPPQGWAELMQSFTPAQVRRRHAEMLSNPAGMVISFAGDVTVEKATALAARYFGGLAPAMAAKPGPKASFSGHDIREEKDNGQLNLFLGFQAPAREDPDRLAAILLQEALSGGLSGPLSQEIRVNRGLAYTTYASYVPNPGNGVFQIYAGTRKGNAGELMKATFALLAKTAREGFSEAELENARARFLRNIQASNEQIKLAAGGNAGLLHRYGRFVPLEETASLLSQITSDDLRRVCVNMLKDGKYALSALGPLDTLPPPQEIFRQMQAAVEGVTAPPARPPSPALSASFAAAGVAEEKTVHAKITVLPNGLTVVTLERPGTLSCGVWTRAGSDHETQAMNGATHINEHMMSKGTPSYPDGSIPKIIEGELHGQLNASTGRDRSYYYFCNLRGDALAKAADIGGEMVFKADISQQQFARGKGKSGGGEGELYVVLEELGKDGDDAAWLNMNLMMAEAYPDQPHGRTILGPEKGLRALTAEQLRAHRDALHKPNNVVFCAVGPVRHEDFVAVVQAKFGDLTPGAVPPLPKPAYKGGTVAAEAATAQACHVTLAADSVSVTDPDVYAYQALGMILGMGYDCRLYKKLVTELGLTSGTSAGTAEFQNGGTFSMSARAQAADVRPLINAMYGECCAVAQNLTEGELARAKTLMEMFALGGFETARDANRTIAYSVQDFGRVVGPAEVSAAIQKLTVSDVKRVAAKILAQNPTAAMIVPPGTDPALLPTHEEVLAMRDGKYTPLPPVPPVPVIRLGGSAP